MARLAAAWAAASTWPDRRAWAMVLALAAATIAALVAGGLASGRLTWAPHRAALADAVLLLVVPAFVEEFVFRGILTPDRRAQGSATLSILPALVLFVLWHPLQAIWLPAAAPMLTDPVFLAGVGLLGFVTGTLRWSTGSIWPGVLVHWAVVLGWQTLFGGPSLRAILA